MTLNCRQQAPENAGDDGLSEIQCGGLLPAFSPGLLTVPIRIGGNRLDVSGAMPVFTTQIR